jgi:hypothetical protein
MKFTVSIESSTGIYVSHWPDRNKTLSTRFLKRTDRRYASDQIAQYVAERINIDPWFSLMKPDIE